MGTVQIADMRIGAKQKVDRCGARIHLFSMEDGIIRAPETTARTTRDGDVLESQAITMQNFGYR